MKKIFGNNSYCLKKPYIREVLQGKQVHFDMELITKDNEHKWNEVSFVPVIDNSDHVKNFYILARDVTKKNRQSWNEQNWRPDCRKLRNSKQLVR